MVLSPKAAGAVEHPLESGGFRHSIPIRAALSFRRNESAVEQLQSPEAVLNKEAVPCVSNRGILPEGRPPGGPRSGGTDGRQGRTGPAEGVKVHPGTQGLSVRVPRAVRDKGMFSKRRGRVNELRTPEKPRRGGRTSIRKGLGGAL